MKKKENNGINRYSIFLYSFALILLEIFIFEIVLARKDVTKYNFSLTLGILLTIVLISMISVIYVSKDFESLKEKITDNKILLMALIITTFILIYIFNIFLAFTLINISTIPFITTIVVLYILGRILENK